MAQSSEVYIKIDVSEARKRLRSFLSMARELNAELARLDEQFDALEEKALELAEYGIRLEVHKS